MYSSSYPKVALVGRPNVGKSTLFNRILGKRYAITASLAGTTRDRIEQVVSWKKKPFVLVDMAGLELQLSPLTHMDRAAQQQVRMGMEDADVLVWILNGQESPHPVDHEIAKLLRSCRKPVVVAVNKCDHQNHDLQAQEYTEFGFMPLTPISAVHGRGVNELLDAIASRLPENADEEARDESAIRVSIVGRPNVGKSTLLNTLIEQERAVVSDIAGTTRDSIDVAGDGAFAQYFPGWRSVRLIDTAGVRRRGKVEQGIEQWSVVRTFDAIDNSEVVLCLMDGREGLVHQDLQVLNHVIESGRALVLIINKWDLLLEARHTNRGSEHDHVLQVDYLDRLRAEAPFLHWCPVVFTSAQEGYNVKYLGELVAKVYEAWSLKPSESDLENATQILQTNPRWKNLQRISCDHAQPPVFHMHVEGKKLPHFSTIRQAENVLRQELEIGPTPIKIWVDTSIPTGYRNGRA